MAGSPQRRARAALERAEYPPLVPWNQWRAYSDAQKFEAIARFSLDDALRFQSVPFDQADLHERNAKLQIFQAVLKLGAQAFRSADRAAEREGTLETLDAALRARAPAQPPTPEDDGTNGG